MNRGKADIKDDDSGLVDTRRLLRNMWPVAPDTGLVDHQKRQPSNRAAAVKGPASQNHRETGTSMRQHSQPHHLIKRMPGSSHIRTQWGYFMSILTEDSYEESDLPVYQFL